jgi:8-oxo-dGTP pyrophosphatase MutT (NUDIX family)
MKNGNGVIKEFSAGGVVTRDGKFLLIRMRNLQGELVWTFPKGHIEGEETPRQAALREVEEESGYFCRVRRSLALVRYSFERKGRPVRKRVRWYWMEPLLRRGKADPKEIFGLRWLGYGAARRLLRYPADFRLLDKAESLSAAGGRRS